MGCPKTRTNSYFVSFGGFFGFVGVTHKVHIIPKYHGACPLVRAGTPHPPLPLASVSPPSGTKGGEQNRLRGEGVVGSQFGRPEKKPSTLSTLWCDFSLGEL